MKNLETNKNLDTNNQWLEIEQCPSCKSLEKKNRGQLPLNLSYTGGTRVKNSVPENDILLYECEKCGLLYKSLIPSKELISKLISAAPEAIWSYSYGYNNEISLINTLLKNPNSYSLLDIGSAHGGLLKASLNYKGRRSALDIVRYPDLLITDDGEFIEGLLDSPNLIWSGNQYDIVTVFDVLEHLYDPSTSFDNLSKFIKKDGFVIIETGDSDRYWYSKEHINLWQYICLFEHHIVWNYRSIEYQARKNGFEIVNYINKKHKYATNNLLLKIKNLLLIIIYSISRKAYDTLRRNMNKKGLQPGNSFSKDHCLVILKKIK